MKFIFGKSKWEMWDDPLEAFLQRLKECGFDATEIYLASLKEKSEQTARLHEQYGLELIGQIITQGKTPLEHLHSFEEQFGLAKQCGAVFINSHAGRDIFPFEENLRIYERALSLGRENNIRVLFETHRGRPTYSAIDTRRYLEALPEMRLTADFSHWMVVHESGLADQEENLRRAIERSDYIHARVGYSEGPQVPDPRAPEWKDTVSRHLSIWQEIIDQRREEDRPSMYMTPEFGPPQYMHTLPFSNQPVGDVWEVNVYMKEFLLKSLRQ